MPSRLVKNEAPFRVKKVEFYNTDDLMVVAFRMAEKLKKRRSIILFALDIEGGRRNGDGGEDNVFHGPLPTEGVAGFAKEVALDCSKRNKTDMVFFPLSSHGAD